LLEPQYLFPRLVLWLAIFAAALADAIRHRNVKVAGYQLQRGIILVLGAQIIQDSLLVAYSFTLHSGAASKIFLVYIFFLDFSDALFIVRGPNICCNRPLHGDIRLGLYDSANNDAFGIVQTKLQKCHAGSAAVYCRRMVVRTPLVLGGSHRQQQGGGQANGLNFPHSEGLFPWCFVGGTLFAQPIPRGLNCTSHGCCVLHGSTLAVA
jgi:hypothetical protein